MRQILRNVALVQVLVAATAWPAGVQAQTPAPAPSAQPAKPAAPKPQPAKPKPKPAPAAPAAAAPAIGGVQPTLLGQFDAWGSYAAAPGGKKVCFALAKPSSAQTNPPNRPRDPIYLFVSSRPAEKVKDEVSVFFGYGFKPNTDASIEVGGAQYAMYTQGDGGWIKNAAEEGKLVEAMRRAADLTIKGVSGRGTTSTDSYSLKGISQALDRANQECGR